MRSMITAFLLSLFVVTITLGAHAQTQVFVPGNASGYFGRDVYGLVPLVPAIAVGGPGTITVTYVSGTVDYGMGIEVGPNGGSYPASGGQFPLQEARGVAPHTKVNNMAALMGVFVPQAKVARKGFTAIDGTKNATRVGIMPGGLFFIGEGKTFAVKEAGTLFLGINDPGVDDNTGGFTVEVSFQQLRTRR
jgi:hypothetical protein